MSRRIEARSGPSHTQFGRTKVSSTSHGSIDPDRERPVVDHDPSSGKPQTHPERVFDQICGLSQPGALLTLVGAGHQHREDLLLMLVPEGMRVAGQKLPLASFEACEVTHVATPAVGL